MSTTAVQTTPVRLSKAKARWELFGAGVLFGLMAVTARFASRGPGGFNAGQLTFLRNTIGAAGTIALFRLNPGTFRPVNTRLLATRGIFGGLAVLLYFIALQRIPAGEATLLNNIFPVFATIFAVLMLGERSTAHLWIALAITTVGVFLVLGGGEVQFGLGWGELAGIGSALLGAGAVTSIRALRPTDNALTIFFAFSLGGMLVSAPLAFSALPADPTFWLAALATGVFSMGAQILMTDSYGALTVPEAAVWQQLTPVASYLWALVLLDEHVSSWGSLGVVLVLGGVLWGALFGHVPAEQR